MQLNGKLIRNVRNVRAFWISFLGIIFGAVFVGLGIYFLISPDQGKTYEVATATITEIQSEIIADEENFYCIVSYIDKEGNSYSNVRLDAYNSSWAVGNEIEIRYNVNDSNDIKTNSSIYMVPIVFMVLGSISLIVGVCVFVKTIKSIKRKANKNIENVASDAPRADNLTDTKLFFHFGGKMNQSYFVENQEGEVVYECKLIKFNPFASNLYEFVDSKTGYSKQIKIGKTITSSSSGGMIFVGDVLSSSFKIDGVNCWEYINDKGYEIKHLLEGKTIIHYEIVKNDKVVANIAPANIKDPFNEDSKNFLRMGKGCYRLEFIDASLEDVVMIAFIIGRTDMVE